MNGLPDMSTRFLTFEYCSLQYLNQWLTYDMGISNALSGNDYDMKLSALKRAGAFYGVARNLPTKHDDENGLPRYASILDIIDNLKPEDFINDTVGEITKTAQKISSKYGERSVISLTTKFLWLKVKQPIIIYDSQARKALKAKDGNLSDYYEKWHKEFSKNQSDILNVCSRLSDMHKYTVNQEIGTKEYIKDISSKTWFHERVFDNYLWNIGAI